MKRFHVLIPDGDYEWLSRVAEENDTPVSELVRSAVSQYRALAERERFIPERATPSETEDSNEGLRQRLMNLEKFVYGQLVTSLGIGNPAIKEVPEYAPDYLLERPPPQ